jgi:hypothetical protein
MFSIFRRRPNFVDQAFRELSDMLTDEETKPTCRRELLDRRRLDGSLESLRHIDDFLQQLHAQPPSEDALFHVALRCGAYVGEVFRAQPVGAGYHWAYYEDAAKYSAPLAGMGLSMGTAAVLWKDRHSLVFPVGKVCKFIENGAEDSVYSFVSVLTMHDQWAPRGVGARQHGR